MNENSMVSKPKTPSQSNSLSLVLAAVTLGSVILINGCSQSEDYAESVSDESSDYASEESVAADTNALMSEQPTAAEELEANSQANELTVESLSGDSEQTLGSQVADIQIKGKSLLITSSADFTVKDVVKSSAAIEALTRQQGGYVAISNISNYPRSDRTFVQGDKNITITTYTRQAEMTVRVPRTNVSKFLKQMQQQVAFLNEQEFTAQDVTLDIYREQLVSQLNSDMASELSEERLDSENNKDQRSNIEAITATYTARRQQELAKLEQMDIADKVKYSTINLVFSQPDISYKEVTQNLDVLIDAERPSFGTEVNKSLKDGWSMLRSFALGVIQLWWLVVLAGIFYLIYRLIKTIYRKFFRQSPRIEHLRRNLMGENQGIYNPERTKSNQVGDNTGSAKEADSKETDSKDMNNKDAKH
ncbi:DUF4349 domain-containing protein [Psychrobacter sp. AOP7-D1-15]|uniref:DUF4349 domain-containing protein n=2 Tax=unclassified Psychrobacter TaxID=196806 RepID=UPI0017883E00|nr:MULTISPECIES: DUF4349 domain-containing protein [unclassified Psychrobacter]MBE0441992.1 DUF4349 domain-containing protein [Psychrobacter sp. FME13]